MPTYNTKARIRAEKKKQKHLEDLTEEKRKLDFIRDSRHVFDALSGYILQSHLSECSREEIREALLYLTRGE